LTGPHARYDGDRGGGRCEVICPPGWPSDGLQLVGVVGVYQSMRPLAVLLAVGVAACAECLAVGPAPAGAQTGFTRCGDAAVHQAGMTYRARHVVQQHTTCARAQGLAGAYFRAISETTHGNHSRQGVCYPTHAYGVCDLIYRGGDYYCKHYNAIPQKTHGLVRCGQNGSRYYKVRVSFNIGF
jgi:hypothetical protein